MSRPWPWAGRRPARPILSVMDSDSELLLRLRSGDERAFVSLVERYHEPMLQLAASFVPSRAVAEEVVQDTWLAVLRGLENFEGRRLAPEDLTPQARDEFVDLYRRWRSEQQ